MKNRLVKICAGILVTLTALSCLCVAFTANAATLPEFTVSDFYQVRPGDTIVLRSTITERRQSLIFAKAEAKVDGKLCCRGNLSFALV